MTASRAPDTEVLLAEELFATIGQLRRQARRLAGRPWPIDTLSGAQTELVRLVRRQPDISVADAAAELGLAANTVSTLVRQLSDAGLLRRSRDTADGRVVRLALTTTARRRVERWRDRRTALTAQAIAELSAADRKALLRSLPVITALASALRTQQAGQAHD